MYHIKPFIYKKDMCLYRYVKYNIQALYVRLSEKRKNCTFLI